MENVRRYRAMGQLCRQQAVFHPEASWHWLGQAERWENLAENETVFAGGNAVPNEPSGLSDSVAA
jgi:hypothetical protein